MGKQIIFQFSQMCKQASLIHCSQKYGLTASYNKVSVQRERKQAQNQSQSQVPTSKSKFKVKGLGLCLISRTKVWPDVQAKARSNIKG